MNSLKYRILIVEEHPIMSLAYEMHLNLYKTVDSDWDCNIHQSRSYDDGHSKIKSAIAASNSYHLVLLGIQFDSAKGENNHDGEHLGIEIRRLSPSTKIAFITSVSNSYRIFSIIEKLAPEGYFLKDQINPNLFAKHMARILDGKIYYSDDVHSILHENRKLPSELDVIDRKILYLLSTGLKTVHLPTKVNLSISGIEKRKRKIAKILQLNSTSTASLVETARELMII